MYNYLRFTYDSYWGERSDPINQRFATQTSAEFLSERLHEYKSLHSKILENSSEKVYQLIEPYINSSKESKITLLSTLDTTYINDIGQKSCSTIINFKKINLLRYLNNHLRSVHEILPADGIYIGKVETYGQRKIKLFKKIGRPLGEIVWLIDFVINRVLPKTKYIDNIYYFFTNGRRTAIS